jgi:tetratricopeptide (TPR) repeat protein
VAAAFVLVLLAVAGSIGWIASDRAAQQAALEGEVNRAVQETGNLMDEAKWPEASARLQRTRGILTAAGRRQLPERFEEIQRDLVMAQRLEEIYSQRQNDEFFTGKAQDQEYADAFKAYGIDIAVLSVAEAAELVRARRIRAQLVLGLDLWANMRYRAGMPAVDRRRLVEIAQAADDDPWRRRLRQAYLRGNRQGDHDTVAALVAEADLDRMSPASLFLLSRTCSDFLQDVEKAIAILSQAQQRYPGDLWLNDNLASAYASVRQFDQAIRFYSVALGLRPKNPNLLCFIGNAQMCKGSYREAIATFERALAVKPDLPRALWGRGDAYLRSGSPKKALADFTRITELEPGLVLGWRSRGLAHDHLHQSTLAIADYDHALSLDSRDVESWRWRGLAHDHLHQWTLAIADYDHALSLDRKDVESWRGRGHAHDHLRQWTLAIADYDHALRLDSKHAPTWHWRGWSRSQSHDWDGALADYSRALSLDHKLTETRVRRADVFCEKGQWARARADFDQLLELEAEAPLNWFVNACLRLQVGDEEGYRELCRRMHDRFSNRNDSPEVLILAHLWALGPQPPEEHARVLQLAQRRMQMEGRRGLAPHILGLAYYRTGRQDKAIALLEQAVRDDPDSDHNVFNFLVLAMAHHRLAHTREAQHWLDRARRQIVREESAGAKDGSAKPPGRAWFDWLCVKLLDREANALINRTSSAIK